MDIVMRKVESINWQRGDLIEAQFTDGVYVLVDIRKPLSRKSVKRRDYELYFEPHPRYVCDSRSFFQPVHMIEDAIARRIYKYYAKKEG